MAFKKPGEPSGLTWGSEAAGFYPDDENTMASLDLYIETLEADKQREKIWLPPASPFHQSDTTFDIYSGLDDGGAPENSSKLHRPASHKDSEQSDKEQERTCAKPTEAQKTKSSSFHPRAFASLQAPGTEERTENTSQSVASSPAICQAQLCAEKISIRRTEGEPEVFLAPTNKDYTDLLDKYRILRTNMLSLLRTAQRELQQKQDTIAELRKVVKSREDKLAREQVSSIDVTHSSAQTEPLPSLLTSLSISQTNTSEVLNREKSQFADAGIQTDITILPEAQVQAQGFLVSGHQQKDVCFKSSSMQTDACILASSEAQTKEGVSSICQSSMNVVQLKDC